jgi:hypothetical protein
VVIRGGPDLVLSAGQSRARFDVAAVTCVRKNAAAIGAGGKCGGGRRGCW